MKKFISLFLIISMFSYANMATDDVSCGNELNAACELFFIKTSDNDSSNGYGFLFDKKGNKIFLDPEYDTMRESVRFGKTNNKYILEQIFLGSNRSQSIFIFGLSNEHIISPRYISFTNGVNVNERKRNWYGTECISNSSNLPKDNHSPLSWAYDVSCKGKEAKQHVDNKRIGNDIIITLPLIIDGVERKPKKLIALNKSDDGIIDAEDLGCTANCIDINKENVFYIGRIKKDIGIGMKLNYKDKNISGYYFYNKIKKEIPLNGILDGEKITLWATDEKNNKVESFGGQLTEGGFKGIWTNLRNNKKYNFETYMKFLQ